MVQITTPSVEARLKAANALPDPVEKASASGDRAVDVYKNVQVLTDLSADQFNRVMASITQWVAPQQGCAYCHNPDNLADDSVYAKRVARRMLQMTRHINVDWKAHVAETGVVCFTCHRGNPVPAFVWYDNPGFPHAGGFSATNDGMGHPNSVNGSTGTFAGSVRALCLRRRARYGSRRPRRFRREPARRSSRPSRPTR